MSIKIGDKVRLRHRTKKITGKVIDIHSDWAMNFLKYKVSYDQDVFPQTDWHMEEDLEILQMELKCNCGVKFVRDGGIHSDWCSSITGGDEE